jgi:striatin 1/3/4
MLEGERRGFANLKLDLMKRVKMLEYALRQERLVGVDRIPTTAKAELTIFL